MRFGVCLIGEALFCKGFGPSHSVDIGFPLTSDSIDGVGNGAGVGVFLPSKKPPSDDGMIPSGPGVLNFDLRGPFLTPASERG